jgi:Flp pilus assembly protein TadG
MRISRTKRKGQSGQAAVEVALMAPWIFFLFVGVFDFGFYAYAAICTQNAARAVALAQAETSTASLTPCNVALGELRMLPNIGNNPTACTSGIVTVSTQTLTNTTTPACADCGNDASASSIRAAVTYTTVPLVPIPGVLTGQLSLTRVAEMRVISP